MNHKLSKEHTAMCKKVQKFKLNNKENKEELFLIIEASTFQLISEAEVTASSKFLLIHLLTQIHFSYKHLYIFAPYILIEKKIKMKKSTAINSLKELEEKGYIKLHSGTNRIQNNHIKEFIFEKTQFYNPMHNQGNIIEMTPFFHKLLKVEK